MTLQQFIQQMPKVELHLHIEGTLEPELMFALAQRNQIELPFKSVQEVREAYHFTNLQSFLDIYYQGAQVLVHEQDFYDLMWAYLKKASEQNVRHAEIFFDPQTHNDRGIPFKTVIDGLTGAMEDAESQLGITSELILCFLRHLSPEAAMKTLEDAYPYRDRILGVGLDSSEKGRPPELFTEVFEKAENQGYLTVAHAGEEGPAEYVWEAINLLDVKRIDHGVRSIEDPKLIDYLVEHEIPLTVCPLSNIKLCVFDEMGQHNIKQLLDLGVRVTVNSDDPAYFGGYMNENFLATQAGLDLSKKDLYQLSRNAIEAAFIDEDKKQAMLDELSEFHQHHLT
ncbi:MAG: adenosine deaminase [Anaerolineaceae bacterium]|nr:adenosine deaminase [Anaerolineaceae bacterium]